VVIALSEIPREVEAVFGYWQTRRRAHNGASIMFQLKVNKSVIEQAQVNIDIILDGGSISKRNRSICLLSTTRSQTNA
jgi:hypothetical protein